MEVVSLLIGLAIGLYINHSRIKEVKMEANVRVLDTKENHRERINEYKDAFAKGYQTKNGYVPYQKEEKEVRDSVHDNEEAYEDFDTHYEKEDERWLNA